MNAIIYSTRRRIINYVKNNILIILLCTIPIIAGIYFSYNAYSSEHIVYTLPVALTQTDYNSITIILSLLYFAISLLTVDNLPVTKSEASFFFLTPIKEQKILLYLFFKSAGYTAITIFGIIWADITLLVPIFKFSASQMAVVVFLQILFFILVMSFNYFLLAIKYKNVTIFNIIRALIVLFIGIVIVNCANIAMRALITTTGPNTNDLWAIIKDLNNFLNSKLFYYIPLLNLVLYSNNFLFKGEIFGILIMILSIIFFFAITYKMQLNLSTKAFDMADKFEGRKKRKKDGDLKLPDFLSTKSIDSSKKIKGYGVNALIYKNTLEFFRQNKYILSASNLMYLMFILLYSVMFMIANDKAVENVLHYIVIGFGCYVLCLIPKKITDELLKPLYLLLPISTLKKIFAHYIYINMENLTSALITFIYCIITGVDFLESLALSVIVIVVLSASASIDFLVSSIFKHKILVTYKILFGMIPKLILFFIFLAISGMSYSATNSVTIAYITIFCSCIFVTLVSLVITKIILED